MPAMLFSTRHCPIGLYRKPEATISRNSSSSLQMPPPGGQLPAQCVAGAGAWAIGRAPTDQVVEQVRMDTLSNSVRVIRPGQAVTMDYRGDRVNIKVNERNAIVGVACG